MNQPDPIEELYDMYSEKEETPCILEVLDNGLEFDLNLKDGLVDLYLEL